MATPEQVKNLYIRRNLSQGIQAVTAAEFVAEFDAATRIKLLAATQQGKTKAVYDVCRAALVRAAMKNLETEAAAIVADGNISLEEADGFL